MATWLGVIVDTRGQDDFWDIARKHGVSPTAERGRAPSHALIDCGLGDTTLPPALAQALSRDASTFALAFVVETTAHRYELHAYEDGHLVRRLAYSRSEREGWKAEEAPQRWEAAYFFDDEPLDPAGGRWPDMLAHGLGERDVARFETARHAGTPAPVLDLLHPSSTAPMFRLCAFFEVSPEIPGAVAKPRSLWTRLLGK